MDRITDRVGIDVETPFECSDERIHVLGCQGSDDVGVVGGADEAMEDAGERTTDEVRGTECLQRIRDDQRYAERVEIDGVRHEQVGRGP